jgi:hypothetical protein
MKAAMSARPRAVLVGALISIAVVLFGLQAWAALPSLTAPTITSKPADPTSSTSATFAFTGPSKATFQCQLDAAALAACTSPKIYAGPLAQGRHTFQVKAISGSTVSSPTSYSWTVDTTPPTVTINQASGQADPTNIGTVAFTATFSEPVTGFNSTAVTVGGTAGGTRSVTITGTGPVYTVTISGATGNGTITASIGAHTVQDLAGNPNAASTSTDNTVTLDTVPPPIPTITAKPASLSNSTTASFSFTDTESGATFRCGMDGSALVSCTSPRSYSNLGEGPHIFAVQAVDAAGNLSNPATYSWSIDSIAPAAPVLTQKPTDPTPNATNTFAWTAEAGATFQCEIENGSWFACTTPYTYVIATTNNQQHQFGVRAFDAAGNVSAGTFYTYKYQAGSSGIPFTITGSVSQLSIGVWKPIAVTISNPNSATIYVSALNVSIGADSTPTGCLTATNIQLQQANVSTVRTVAVPAHGSVMLPAQTVTAPQILLKNLSTNQDVCKNKSFSLSYTGTATN